MKINELRKMIREELSELNLSKNDMPNVVRGGDSDKKPTGIIALRNTAQSLVQRTPQNLTNQEAELLNSIIEKLLKLSGEPGDASPIYNRIIQFMATTTSKM